METNGRARQIFLMVYYVGLDLVKTMLGVSLVHLGQSRFSYIDNYTS